MVVPPARCELCQQDFSSTKAARKHASTTGHIVSFGYLCRQCGQSFETAKRYYDHLNAVATGHPEQLVPCTECSLRFSSIPALSAHRQTVHFKPRPLVTLCSQEVPIGGAHPLCPNNSLFKFFCPICRLRFANHGELAQHVANVSTCISCGICLVPSETLADHFWTSKVHPKCRPCKLGFDTTADLAQHNLSCKALHSPNPPAPSDVLPLETESIDTTRVSTPFIVLDTGPSPRPLQSAVPQEDAGTPSWHCRSCLVDPCVDPVATTCGHLFCHGCFVRELGEKTCCPVCGKAFYVRLRVGS